MTKLVHLYPTGEGFIHDYPTAEVDVDEATAAELLAYSPPIFTTEPTGWPPPADEATDSTEGPVDTGPSDSTPEE